MTEEKEHAAEIRSRAHQLAAEGIRAALNMWELDTYYVSQADQDALELELLAIARRLEKRASAARAPSSQPAAGARQDGAQPGGAE